MRTFRADCRRGEIIALLHRWGWSYGVQAQIARHLGVHRSTVSRDLNRILPLFQTCAACGELRRFR